MNISCLQFVVDTRIASYNRVYIGLTVRRRAPASKPLISPHLTFHTTPTGASELRLRHKHAVKAVVGHLQWRLYQDCFLQPDTCYKVLTVRRRAPAPSDEPTHHT